MSVSQSALRASCDDIAGPLLESPRDARAHVMQVALFKSRGCCVISMRRAVRPL